MATALPFAKPANSAQYAADLDVEAGAPLPLNPAALAVTSAWVQSESPSFPGYNGLGTELYLPGATPDPSNSKVYDYRNLQDGLKAAVDMMTGTSPQKTPLAPRFVQDLRSGNATASQLVADIAAGNGSTSWTGSGPDTYDSTAIISKLKNSNFSITGSAASPQVNINTAGFGLNPLQWPQQAVSTAAGAIGNSVKLLVLKGILTLMGAGMVYYGLTLLSNRNGSSSDRSAGGMLANDPELLAA